MSLLTYVKVTATRIIEVDRLSPSYTDDHGQPHSVSRVLEDWKAHVEEDYDLFFNAVDTQLEVTETDVLEYHKLQPKE